jgi:SagB-type dehydrogenase family enzyme
VSALPKAEAVHAYHGASKHHLDRYAPGPGYLDWANQPEPFRVYAGCERIELPLLADRLDVRYADVRAGRLPPPAPLDRSHLGALFELGLGLAAWKEYAGSRWALRCNPSSGNLHPTEGYLIAPPLPDLPPGVYHYLSRDHVLERRAELSTHVGSPVYLGLTSIVWREAWKYGLRAFRYCQLDIGHAIGALAFAAAALGWRLRLLDAIAQDRLAALLGVGRQEDFGAAEPELPECLLLLQTDQADGDTDPAAVVASLEAGPWQGRANRLSAEHRAWPGLEDVGQATRRLETSVPTAVRPYSPPERPPPSALPLDPPLSRLIRQRRSAQEYDGVTRMSADTLLSLLARLLPAAAPPWTVWPWAPAVHLLLFVHRVDGLEPGLYCLLRSPADLHALKSAMRSEWLWAKQGPAELPFYLLLPHDLRAVAARLSCHQAIAADSCFAVAMLAGFADLGAAPWLYRRRHWEAGLIGQVLYLEAEAAGVRGTGIGCFFDDEVHRLLGLEPEGHWQVVYHFTVGGPLEDRRLTTLPPYPEDYARRR